MTKLEALFNQFQKGVDGLKRVLEQEKNEFIRDSSIQRFEFTFDLSWKLIKAFLEENKGVICNSPKGCFKEAYKQGLIEYDDFWIIMTDYRNKTSHIYNEELAEEVYAILPKVLSYFQKLLVNIQNQRTEPRIQNTE